MRKLLLLLLCCWFPALFAQDTFAQDTTEQWIQLFNGKDLSNWKIKFTGYELGENYRNTFRVEEGVFKVSYDEWDNFDGQFGHIYTDRAFSNYRIRVEYRFIDEQVNNGPGWAFRNNGIMLHSQAPESLILEQEFPVSIEAQMLGGNGNDERTNGNVCTPGTHIVMNNELIKIHCTNSQSRTYHGDQWITMEVEVLGDESIKQWINGELVLQYQQPQLDPDDADAQRLIQAGAPIALASGHIALQAETHPIEFRKVELLVLEP